jgi:two-component system, chemotaxis family, protein-glutamate methylesterase/glutaminase
MGSNQIVVIGTSAGGIEALREIAASLPHDFPSPLCVVMHMSPESPGILDDILTRSGPLQAVMPRDGQRLAPGFIYVAPPDCHLVVEPGKVRVTKGPRENRFRPAIDPLFRSAAQVYGPAAIGVILTGNLDDGTAGLWAIKQLGGIAVVQDPSDASFPSMPSSAIAHVTPDYVVPVREVPQLLARLVATPVAARAKVELPHLEVEVKIAKEEGAVEAGVTTIGTPSSYACPECHGVLLQLKEGSHIRFRCHTGHAYSVDSLIAAVHEGIEEALWNSVRALEEGGILMERMTEHVEHAHGRADAEQLAARADEAKRQADALRKLVMERQPMSAEK